MLAITTFGLIQFVAFERCTKQQNGHSHITCYPKQSWDYVVMCFNSQFYLLIT